MMMIRVVELNGIAESLVGVWVLRVGGEVILKEGFGEHAAR